MRKTWRFEMVFGKPSVQKNEGHMHGSVISGTAINVKNVVN